MSLFGAMFESKNNGKKTRKKKNEIEKEMGACSDVISYNSKFDGLEVEEREREPEQEYESKSRGNRRNDDKKFLERDYLNYDEMFMPKKYVIAKKMKMEREKLREEEFWKNNNEEANTILYSPVYKKKTSSDKKSIKKKKSPSSPINFGSSQENSIDKYKKSPSFNNSPSYSPSSSLISSGSERNSPENRDIFSQIVSFDDDCFFCHYYSGSNVIKKETESNVKEMLKIIEFMLGKSNCEITQVGHEVELYYRKNIYNRFSHKFPDLPFVDSYMVVNHYENHIRINPTIHYKHSFEILFNLRKKLLDNVCYTLKEDQNQKEIVDKESVLLIKGLTDSMHRCHNADPKKSCFYPGDSFAWTADSKGQFLNSGYSLTKEQKKNFDRWDQSEIEYESAL